MQDESVINATNTSSVAWCGVLVNRKLLVRHAFRLVGVFLFIYILLQIDFGLMIETALGINPFITILLVIMVTPIMFFKGARWHAVCTGLELNLKTDEAIEALCVAHMVNLILPGTVGDLVRVPYLQRRGNPLEQSILSLFLDAAISIIFPYTAGILAILYILEIRVEFILIALLTPLLWAFVGILAYLGIKKMGGSLLYGERLKRMWINIRDAFVNLGNSITSIGKRQFLISLVLSGAAWLVYTVQGFILAIALHIEVNWLYVVISLGLSTLLTAIPITIAGLGIREGVLLYMFGLMGYTPTLIVSYSLTLMLINLTPSIAGFVSWARNPLIGLDELGAIDGFLSEPEIAAE
jgi:uncharacterized protein (TIRG00374 family)